jgi:hypothetical protein
MKKIAVIVGPKKPAIGGIASIVTIMEEWLTGRADIYDV